MGMRIEKIVNLIEELIDLKVREALKGSLDSQSGPRKKFDREAVEKVKHQLVNLMTS
jgi:hypothetical protein